MKKAFKTIVATSTLAVTAVSAGIAGLNPAQAQTSHNKVQSEAFTTGYHHHGEAGKQAGFLTSTDFRAALDNGDLSFNGYRLTSNFGDDEFSQIKVDDQVMQKVGALKQVRSVAFQVSDPTMNLKQLQKAYGSALHHVSQSGVTPQDGVYYYDGDAYSIQFTVEAHHVKHVLIGDPVVD